MIQDSLEKFPDNLNLKYGSLTNPFVLNSLDICLRPRGAASTMLSLSHYLLMFFYLFFLRRAVFLSCY